jgi:ATP-dependent DNA helicase RecG
VRPFAAGQIALVRVSALPEDRKFCLYRGEARERVADRDEKIPRHRVDEQEERKREMETYRELRPVESVGLSDLSLQRINELVLLINQGQSNPIETIKSTLADAVPFLEKKRFMLKDGQITTLGVLVCGARPEDHLLFKSQMDAFVDVPNSIAQDKKTFRDNILQLMEQGHGWTLRNIMTGVSPEAGGTLVPEYPEKLIRECINNALAHRDYSINRPVQLTLKPRVSLSIRNPGQLPHELVFEQPNDRVPVRRIFANPLARNPRLADILKLHNKWEGKGIGMSELVNYALANKINVPHYIFHSADELSLCMKGWTVGLICWAG